MEKESDAIEGLPHCLGITSLPILEEDSLPSEFWLLSAPVAASVTAAVGLLKGQGGREPREGKKEGKWKISTLSQSVRNFRSPPLNTGLEGFSWSTVGTPRFSLGFWAALRSGQGMPEEKK